MNARALPLSLCLAIWAGCPSYESESAIYLQRITATPVTMTAEVDYDYQDPSRSTITLSEGAAMGLGCTEYCANDFDNRAPCARTTVRASPEGLASVREAFMLNGREGTTVLVGLSPGTGTIEVSSPCVSATYRLVIEPR